MPDSLPPLPHLVAPGAAAPPPASRRAARHSRPPLTAFVADGATERAVADGVADAVPGAPDVRRGGVRAAIAAMRAAVSPAILVVDVSGEDQPLAALGELAALVEPDVCVLVIGEADSVDFYREVTRGLGANDYLAKPVTADRIARFVGAIAAGQAPVGAPHGGGLAILTGVRGGVGATTLAVHLAGCFGVTMRRHTVLLDPDLHFGDAAFLLNVTPGPGLRMALEAPERIDALLAERAAQPAADRLHVLAGDEPPGAALTYAPNGAAQLMAALRRRYTLVVADVPHRQEQLLQDLLAEPHQRVLVMLPTLASVRATLRLMPGSAVADKAKRPILVLNRLGMPGGMTRRETEDALGAKVDVAIADLPRAVLAAATMGELSREGRGGLRGGVAELARLVASAGMLAPLPGPLPAASRRGLFARLFRRA